MKKYKEILTGIIKEKSTWTGLKQELSKYNIDNREAKLKDTSAGKIFEVFSKYYFLTAPELIGTYESVWLYDEIPLSIKTTLNLGSVEYGIDLLLETFDKKYIAVQCKFKNDETTKLYWSVDKIANLFAYVPNADGFIVFSNAATLDKVSLTRQDKFTFYSIGHLLEIEKETFSNIHKLLVGQMPGEKTLFEPKPHQQKAIDECVQWFTEGELSRGQLILPCGAGKTFTALWIKERLRSKNTLVLVPSLALLRQIKNEWAKQKRTEYTYLCVCSEKDIDKDNQDSIVTHTYEIGGNVTTEPDEIKKFLDGGIQDQVVFSTYQSLPAIAKAIEKINFEFDYVFCDEAHKTAGVSKGVFGLIHDNITIPAQKRLYATATPRIVKESLKKKLGDNLKYTHDMNDPETFGEEFYRMSFKDAIEEGILVDYKIIAIGVNDRELANYIRERRFVEDNISLDEVANNYALNYVMEKYEANHALTFHSRVLYAREFSSRHASLFEETASYAVDGSQPTSIRNQILNEFKNSRKAIISNARCLTEGVDVPTIDLVYFSDPKNSKVDIIQAVGRALRKKAGKERGYVVVPIYHTSNKDVEHSISEGSFKNLLQVIRSLCDQDERLQDEINALAFGKGSRKSKRLDIISQSFDEEVEALKLVGFEEQLKESLFDQIIEKTSNNWDIWLLELKRYLELYKDYPSKSANKDLYSWVAQQRNKKNKGGLDFEQIRKLNAINFVWDIVKWKWDKMYDVFKSYAEDNVFPPYKGFDDPELVTWHRMQIMYIKNNKILTSEQINKFERINNKFQGPGSRKRWLDVYDKLADFRKENPNKWPGYDKQNSNTLESKLSVFCLSMRKRFKANDLGDYWFDKMVQIGFNFEGHADNWTKYFEEVKQQILDKNSVSVKEIGDNAYSWLLRHKKLLDKGRLSKYQVGRMQELSLDNYFESWDIIFDKVKQWVLENGKIPTKHKHKDHHSWLSSQRLTYKKGNLTNEQIEKLKSIEFDLIGLGKEKNEQKWMSFFLQLKEFLELHNQYPGPTHEKELYNWVQSQRSIMAGNSKRNKPLSQIRQDMLNSINFQWIGSGRTNKPWEDYFKDFVSHLNPEGKLELSTKINGKSNPLYTWWRNQKIAYANGKLSEERIKAFKDIGIDTG